MNEEQPDIDLSKWLPTYGLITVERLLECYNIRLKQDDLLSALKTPNSFYHQLTRLPLRNVYNGIIFQQARDYQAYAQKMFIDYLLSGESGKSDDSPGALVRHELEEKRQELTALGERFHDQELNQEKLIAESQSVLIQHTEDWQKALKNVALDLDQTLRGLGHHLPEDNVERALTSLLVHYDFRENKLIAKEEDWKDIEAKFGMSLNPDLRQVFVEKLVQLNDFSVDANESMQEFSRQISDMSQILKTFRSQFYDLIIKVTDLIKQLPEYHMDMVQAEINRQDLHFDVDIGS